MKIPNADSTVERSLRALEYQQLPSAHTPATNTTPQHGPQPGRDSRPADSNS